MLENECGNENTELKLAKEQCKERMEQKKGKYNFNRLLEQQKDTLTRLDVPIIEFTGPIEVKVEEASGRGIYATRDIAEGELLLAEKATFIGKKREVQRLEMEQCLINLISPEQVPILRNAQIELFNSEYKRNVINVIYNGRNQNEGVNINKIEEEGKRIGSNPETSFVIEDLNQIIKYNSCQCWNLDEIFKFLKTGKNRQQFQPSEFGRVSAIWTKFSFMNHSCMLNTNRFSIGDVLFVTAMKPIKKGEQIFTTYIPIDIPF